MSTAYVQISQCIQYTGSNGQAIATELGMEVQSDDGLTLTLRGRNVDGFSIPKTYWLVWIAIGRSGEVQFEQPVPPGQFLARYKLAV